MLYNTKYKILSFSFMDYLLKIAVIKAWNSERSEGVMKIIFTDLIVFANNFA